MNQSAAVAEAPARAKSIPALTTSKPARFAVIMALYFLQGVPFGLTTVALTAWLAAQGATPVEIGAFVAFAVLPWSAKLFNGLLMDRFTFKPMGRRRSWILAAQGMMIATLLAMAVLAPTANDIALLSGLCFVLKPMRRVQRCGGRWAGGGHCAQHRTHRHQQCHVCQPIGGNCGE